MDCDVLVVGAGFAGATVAERLASRCNLKVVIVDKRRHIGGNSYDETNESGVLVHKYGPHYFRTNSAQVLNYLSQFTEWLPAKYKILSWAKGRLWQFPINLNTFEQFIGRSATSAEMTEWLKRNKAPIAAPANSEEKVVSQVGWELYEQFYRNYTLKQWGVEPRLLDASVCGRIPIRTNRDDRYFTDTFQAMPKHGYARLFSKMLDHPNIRLLLNEDYRETKLKFKCRHLVYTGAIDEYYNYRLGQLQYRSLRFEHETIPVSYYQPVVQINYPDEHSFTRSVEIKHVTGQTGPNTTIVREYPEEYGKTGERFYPIHCPKSKALYDDYERLSAQERNVTFLGRLGCYRYYNMDQTVAQALTVAMKLGRKLMQNPKHDSILE